MSDANEPRRWPSIDALRGAAMVLMALDHTRAYFTNLAFEPESLEPTWGALFLVRWVTHFCAPLFFFLAGTGAFFYGERHGMPALRRFLWTRGLWLIALEFTVVGFAWTFVAPWGFFGVLWALGAAMLLLAGTVRLPLGWLVAGALAVVLLHDLADPVRPDALGRLAWLWSLLHAKGGIAIGSWHSFVLFPLVPWCAVMALGYAFGALLRRPDGHRWTLRLGTAAVLLFVLLRATNLYGNPPHLPGGVTPGDFHPQPTFEKSWILFLDTEKYPPSLQFLLMTLGPSLLALAGMERRARRRVPGWMRVLAVFGRVPLFFYVAHLYAIHLGAALVAWLGGQPVAWLFHGAFWFHGLPEGYGHGLRFVVAAWIAVVALLYWPCRRWAALKAARPEAWLLRYL